MTRVTITRVMMIRAKTAAGINNRHRERKA
jgi:hypothetical protein